MKAILETRFVAKSKGLTTEVFKQLVRFWVSIKNRKIGHGCVTRLLTIKHRSDITLSRDSFVKSLLTAIH